ncbi:MAG: cyclic nucleotide-binding domain-containing protein [Proteobacteria bacterium]|nr:cyclic nucleotide-binding domain-containing protein [Pseudomonadota bacterium]HQR03493.1 cyclic nucleotide-binding domain-containing protein [Rhodocyclaceae bacterium]
MDLKTFLHGLPAFERFQSRHVDALVERLQVQEIAAGQTLIHQDQPGQALYIVLSGSISLTRRDPIAGEFEEAGEARDGEVIGLLSLVADMPAPETVFAHSNVTVAALLPEDYHALHLVAPPIAQQLEYMVAVQLARELQAKNKQLRRGLAQRKTPSLIERLMGVSS